MHVLKRHAGPEKTTHSRAAPQFSCSFMFFHVLSCSFIFFHVLSCSCIFFQYLSFSFIFCHFLSCSFMFFQFLSISFIFFHLLTFIFVHFETSSYTSFTNLVWLEISKSARNSYEKQETMKPLWKVREQKEGRRHKHLFVYVYRDLESVCDTPQLHTTTQQRTHTAHTHTMHTHSHYTQHTHRTPSESKHVRN